VATFAYSYPNFTLKLTPLSATGGNKGVPKEEMWVYPECAPRNSSSSGFEGVPPDQILHYFKSIERILEAYPAGDVYGTQQFADKVYKSHRKVSIAPYIPALGVELRPFIVTRVSI
jgi:hypothetical protein